MTDDDYLYAVLNCDDTSGEATDAAALAVYRLRVRAEKAEAAITRVRELADRVARYHGDGLPRIKPRDIYRALEGDSE